MTARRSGRPRASECRIDSHRPVLGVISRAADPERAAHAMAAVDEN